MNPGRAFLRVVRGMVLATCFTMLGLAGHAGGGAAIRLGAPSLVAAVLIAAGSVAWADRQRGFGQLLGAAACTQLAFHLTLSLSPETAMAAHAAVDQQMLVGHVAGGILMTTVLARADAAVWGLYRSARRLANFPPVVLLGPVVDRSPHIPRRGPAGVGAGLLLATATPHRGPPRMTAA